MTWSLIRLCKVRVQLVRCSSKFEAFSGFRFLWQPFDSQIHWLLDMTSLKNRSVDKAVVLYILTWSLGLKSWIEVLMFDKFCGREWIFMDSGWTVRHFLFASFCCTSRSISSCSSFSFRLFRWLGVQDNLKKIPKKAMTPFPWEHFPKSDLFLKKSQEKPEEQLRGGFMSRVPFLSSLFSGVNKPCLPEKERSSLCKFANVGFSWVLVVASPGTFWTTFSSSVFRLVWSLKLKKQDVSRWFETWNHLRYQEYQERILTVFWPYPVLFSWALSKDDVFLLGWE